MRRRNFLISALGASVSLRTADAQQRDKPPAVGVLISIGKNDPQIRPRIEAFEQSLQKLGWRPGDNMRINYRFGEGDPRRLNAEAAALVETAPDVVLALGSPSVSALQRETNSIPIIFVLVEDPVGGGFVASMAHPGGNMTGFSSVDYTIGGKWLELLKEIAPGVKRVGVILDRHNVSSAGFMGTMEASAPKLSADLTVLGYRDAEEITKSLDTFAREPNGGLICLPSPIATSHRSGIINQANQLRLPAVYAYSYFARGGGLISYGVDIVDLFRRAGPYVNAILRGAKPDNMPVQAPTKFELAVNLRTAKALGLTVPQSVFARADEVVE